MYRPCRINKTVFEIECQTIKWFLKQEWNNFSKRAEKNYEQKFPTFSNQLSQYYNTIKNSYGHDHDVKGLKKIATNNKISNNKYIIYMCIVNCKNDSF